MVDEINEPMDIAVPVFNDENEDRKCIADDQHSLQEIEKRLSMIRTSARCCMSTVFYSKERHENGSTKIQATKSLYCKYLQIQCHVFVYQQ